MKKFIVLILLANVCYGQSPDTAKYNLPDVIKMVRKQSNGTKKIISTIAKEYEGESEQLELITFYKRTYDYKVIDKNVLKNLIDSLCVSGINENVKQTARESRNFIENRFLGKGIKDFELPDKNGKPIKLSAFNDKIVIIELWATWCGPCVKDMPKIPALRKGNQNIEFYSISLDKSEDKMKKFIEKNGYDWPIVFGGYEDVNQELWQYLHIVAVPKYYAIDRNGIVINVADKLDEEFISGLK